MKESFTFDVPEYSISIGAELHYLMENRGQRTPPFRSIYWLSVILLLIGLFAAVVVIACSFLSGIFTIPKHFISIPIHYLLTGFALSAILSFICTAVYMKDFHRFITDGYTRYGGNYQMKINCNGISTLRKNGEARIIPWNALKGLDTTPLALYLWVNHHDVLVLPSSALNHTDGAVLLAKIAHWRQ